MAAGKGSRPIIIKKVKKQAAGHHGGSWKVAYADFVTAMMAFFLVMWIVGMDDQTKKAIEGYFSNPVGYKKGYSAGASPLSTGSSPGGAKQPPLRLIIRAYEQKRFDDVTRKLSEKVAESQALLGTTTQVEIVVTEQGLRIELIEGRDGETFFPLASAQLKQPAVATLQLIAEELNALANPIIIEGHTDAALYRARAGYTNWELSADRANAARRVLEGAGVNPARVAAVRGLADRELRLRDDPRNPANRRISILLPFSQVPDQPASDPNAPSNAAAMVPSAGT